MSEACFTIETHSNRADWLRARKRGIGASEAAAILGFDRMKTAYTIATDKLTERIDDSKTSEEAYWGLADEPAITKRFCEETGLTVTDPGNWTIYRSKERPHIFSTPDRLMLPMAALEIKETFGGNGREWQNDVPRKHKVQLQQTMYVLGVPKGYFAARINTGFGVEFRYHPMNRSDKFLSWALPKLDAFWESIQRGEMPDIDGSLATARALSLRYDRPEPTPVELPDELEADAAEFDRLQEVESKAKKDRELLRNRIKAAMGNHTVGVLPNGSGFSWNANGSGSRTLRRIEKVRLNDG